MAKSSQSLSFLILGEPGIGKSTLINGLLGKAVAKVSKPGEPETHGVTRDLECHNQDIEGVDVIIWDTPGLLDPEIPTDKILQDIKRISDSIDLFLLCIDMGKTRVYATGNEAKMIGKIDEILGKQFWAKSIVVLVQANMVIEKIKLDEDNEDAIAKSFKNSIKTWKKLMKKKTTTGKVKVVPAGFYKQPKFFPEDKVPWLSNFWKKVCKRLPVRQQAAFVKVSKNRLLVYSKSGQVRAYHEACSKSVTPQQNDVNQGSQAAPSTHLSNETKPPRPIPKPRQHRKGVGKLTTDRFNFLTPSEPQAYKQHSLRKSCSQEKLRERPAAPTCGPDSTTKESVTTLELKSKTLELNRPESLSQSPPGLRKFAASDSDLRKVGEQGIAEPSEPKAGVFTSWYVKPPVGSVVAEAGCTGGEYGSTQEELVRKEKKKPSASGPMIQITPVAEKESDNVDFRVDADVIKTVGKKKIEDQPIFVSGNFVQKMKDNLDKFFYKFY